MKKYKASWRRDEGAASCRDEAWRKMVFTLHELISDVVWFGQLPENFRLMVQGSTFDMHLSHSF